MNLRVNSQGTVGVMQNIIAMLEISKRNVKLDMVIVGIYTGCDLMRQLFLLFEYLFIAFSTNKPFTFYAVCKTIRHLLQDSCHRGVISIINNKFQATSH